MMPGCVRTWADFQVHIDRLFCSLLRILLTLTIAKTHVRKAAKELDVQTGYIYLPGQEEKLYEDSDMGPEFRQRRQYVLGHLKGETGQAGLTPSQFLLHHRR
jgi:hypothetical protein